MKRWIGLGSAAIHLGTFDMIKIREIEDLAAGKHPGVNNDAV